MTDIRKEISAGLDHLMRCSDDDLIGHANHLIASDAVWDISDPVNRLAGREAILEGFIRPLRAALTAVHRRDEIVIGGQNIRDEGGYWTAILTHYVSTFSESLFGLLPSGKLGFLRSGEFYRIDDGQITKARIIIDLPDLARQSGRSPFPPMLGTETLFPGPATHDGVCPTTGDGAASLDLVQRMLGDLHVYDPETGASHGQTGSDGHWHEDMLWYGPGGVGSTYRWDGFVDDHRAAFLSAFPDRKGGNHYCRIGDGNYAAVSGWPSMTMTHRGSYLGVPTTNLPLTLRVMDFYRCEFTNPRGKIAENWVCLDYVDLFRQMGVDLIARANALTPA